ncbi:MAG: metal ABC transporter substrate-binding protein [Eubacteriales bacterium]|nr:metal ABC transporter substrate-binding protein [Eubacteriales bacterium]
MNKKIITNKISKFFIMLIFASVFLCLASCSKNNTINESSVTTEETTIKKQNEKISIVCTIFPLYDFVKEIIKQNEDKFDLTLLIDNGIDFHNYTPTVDDDIKIRNANIFFYIGGESDSWASKIIESNTNNDLNSINMMNELKDIIKVEEEIEGMEKEEEDLDSEEIEHDEHIWLSLLNAQKMISIITNEIIKLDKENENIYLSNLTEYNKKLRELDKEYKNTITQIKNNTILFADRFPFRYLFDDYNLKYFAAFKGCSAETECSFDTIMFLSNKVKELSLDNIYVIDGSSKRIANTIITNSSNKNINIQEMNSMQGITLQDINSGKNYLNIMKENLNALSYSIIK